MTDAPSSSQPSRYPSRADEQPGLAARRAALKLLDAVMRRGQPLETALHAATQGIGGASGSSDRALAHAIAAETLRRVPDLDVLIDSVTPRPLPEDAKARMVIRMALTQMLVLGTPPHAAIATALPLVDGGPRKLVHGVLGALGRAKAKLPEAITLPAGVAERWAAQWGEGMAGAASVALATRPPLDLTLRDVGETAIWLERLGGTSLAPGHIRLDPDQDVTALAGFAEGAWWVQDVAASIAARLLGASEGGHVLDICAAPGGKTMQLASQGWRVTALDKSKARLTRLVANLERTGLTATVEAGDALKWSPEAPADAVLLDAPCSATGIFRRHPDVLHRVGPRQVAEMAEIQEALLARAADWIGTGGRLVYATCSLERAEGEEQIERFLSGRPDFRCIALQPDILPEGIVASPEGWVRTTPETLAASGGTDGFFIALLERSGAG
ncbi:MAG TPA: RsmB/NOP family class I SAM-dependent RNA methyltransferase [Sphingobium sp.]|uniref:RsmB/NOP family class I SAM-dependent RNA methyltransferase n=1 Tax=Sphingobium sp. TaxID=1912891 RepID=UPI002ED49553